MTRAPTKRQAAALETRRSILAAAKEIYSTEADIEAPISRLARKAGVAEGTIFAHFPDKASVLAAALVDEIEQALTGAWASLPKDAPCREQLLHLAQGLYFFYALRPSLFRVLIKESLFLQGEWGKRTTEYILHFVARVAELMERAKARGEYRKDSDSLLAARSFFALYFIELVAGLNEDTFNPEKTLLQLRAAVLQLETGLINTMEGAHA